MSYPKKQAKGKIKPNVSSGKLVLALVSVKQGVHALTKVHVGEYSCQRVCLCIDQVLSTSS